MKANPYIRLGLILCISGAALAPFFYFVLGSTPLAASALSAIMLGLVSAMLGRTRPSITPEACQVMLKTGVENTAALLEELGIESKAIYLPSSKPDGLPRALIPLNGNGTLPDGLRPLPERLIARYGANLEDMCLIVATPGSVSLEGASLARGAGPGEIESALNTIISGTLDLADTVAVQAEGDRYIVQLGKPKLSYDNMWYYRCLGSPLASIVASVCAQALDRPVRIGSEEQRRDASLITVEVLP